MSVALAAQVPQRDFFRIPDHWGIQKQLGDVQKAVDELVAKLENRGIDPTKKLKDAWSTALDLALQRAKLPCRKPTAKDKAEGREPGLVRPGRLLGQAALLLNRLVRTPVPVFFHTQMKIARVLRLGEVRDPNDPNFGKPKPVQRAAPDPQRGEPDDRTPRLLEAPGVRQTRAVVKEIEALGLFKLFHRNTEAEHELGAESRSIVTVLDIPDELLDDVVRELNKPRRRRAAQEGAPPTPAGARGTSTPSRRPPAVRSIARPARRGGDGLTPVGLSERDDPCFVELAKAHLQGHAAKYRVEIEATGTPYTAACASTIALEYRPAVVQALKGFVEQARSRALTKNRDLTDEQICRGLFPHIVDAFLARDSSFLRESRHAMGGLWGKGGGKDGQLRDLEVLGPGAIDRWADGLAEGEGPDLTRMPRPPGAGPIALDEECAGAAGGAIVVSRDGLDAAQDAAEAREQCDELRQRYAAAGLLTAGPPTSAIASEPAPEAEPDLDWSPSPRRGLTSQQREELARIDAAGTPSAAQQPIQKPP